MNSRRKIFRAAAAVLAAMPFGLVGPTAALAEPALRPPDHAGRFMVGVVREKMLGEYEQVWQTLYPRHQRVAEQAEYAGCEGLVPAPGTLVGVRALHVYPHRIRIAGNLTSSDTRAVKIRVSVLSPVWPVPIVLDQTFHAVAVQRHWTWILSAYQYEYYLAGTCPYA